MKLLFVYGCNVFSDVKGNKYTNGTITIETWKNRYKKIGDVTFISYLNKKIYSVEDAQKRFSMIDNQIIHISLEHSSSSLKNLISWKIRNKNNKIIKEQVKKADCIIARVPSDCAYTAIKYAIKYNKPYMVEVVGCSFDAYWNYGLKGKIIAIPAFLKQKYYVSKSKYTVYVSNNFLQKRYPTDGKSINCSNVILDNLDNLSLKKRMIKIENTNFNSKIIVGTIGGLNVNFKGQQYVIKALAKLKKMGINNLEYQLIGSGDATRLEKLVNKYNLNDEVKIIGSVSHDKIFDWLDNLDLYIQPSNQEGLCRSIIEAESRACPIVASNAGGNSELINNEYIFKKRNVKQLMNKILKILNKEQFMIESKNNFENSKLYKKEILIERRNNFNKIWKSNINK